MTTPAIIDLTEVYASGWMLRNLLDQSIMGQKSWWCALTKVDDRFLTKAGAGVTPTEAIYAALAAETRTYNWREPASDEGTELDPGRKPLLQSLGLVKSTTPINRRF